MSFCAKQPFFQVTLRLITLGIATSSTKQWTVVGGTSFECLTLNNDAAVPQLGEKQVLVKLAASSL
jgi:hypothetical protein